MADKASEETPKTFSSRTSLNRSSFQFFETIQKGNYFDLSLLKLHLNQRKIHVLERSKSSLCNTFTPI